MNLNSKKLFALITLSTLLLTTAPSLAQTTYSNGTTPAPAPSTPVFSDVTSTNENVDAIKYLKDQHIIQGYEDGSYAPDQKINRAEFLKILIGSKYDNLTGKNCFPDVKDEWFAPYVCKAVQLKIVDGYADGTFKPDQNITFAEAAKIIVKTYAIGTSMEGNSDTWFEGFMKGLELQNDIPLSVEYFNQEIDRAEMAEMVYRLKAKIKDKASRTYAEIQGDDPYTVKTCRDLEERYLDSANRYTPQVDYIEKGFMPMEDAVSAPRSTPTQTAPAPAASGNAGASAAGTATEHSTTNLQVAGVDEGDIVKNDGRYIYMLKQNSVRIVDAYPSSNLKELVKFEFTNSDANFYPSDLYIDGNSLVIVGNTSSPIIYTDVVPADGGGTNNAQMMPIRYPSYNSSRVKVFVMDITDRTKPKVTRTSEFEGYLNTSRKVNDTLYLVMNYSQYYPIPYYGIYRPQFQNFGLYMPKMKDSMNGADEQIVPCDQVHILPHSKDFNYLITAAVPLVNLKQPIARSVAIGNTDNVFSSENNLYVAATNWAGPYWKENFEPTTKLFRLP